MMRVTKVLFYLAIFSCVMHGLAQTPASTSVETSAPSYENDPKFISKMDEAKDLEKHRQLVFAVDAYRKANKLADGHCWNCLEGAYRGLMAMGEYKDAVSTAVAQETIAATDANRVLADENEARALLAQGGDKPKPALLQSAHTALQNAISVSPKSPVAYFLDGKVLALMGNMDPARASFQECASLVQPNDPSRLRIEHFAENPELAVHKMAPPVVVTALDGSKFNLDAMGGRVVLIDFWATWCGPCNAELPHMKKIAREFAGDPLVIISVSWDADDTKWKDFIKKNEMTWVQYRDQNHRLSMSFGINAIPHYFTIDSDGVLTAEMLGEGADVESKLKKLLARAKAAQKTQPMVKDQNAGD